MTSWTGNLKGLYAYGNRLSAYLINDRDIEQHKAGSHDQCWCWTTTLTSSSRSSSTTTTWLSRSRSFGEALASTFQRFASGRRRSLWRSTENGRCESRREKTAPATTSPTVTWEWAARRLGTETQGHDVQLCGERTTDSDVHRHWDSPLHVMWNMRSKISEINFWMSGGGSRSRLHRDAFNAINCQLNGTKYWIMVPNNQTKNVYFVASSKYEMGGLSPVNADAVDLKKYPRFRNVPWGITVVEAGNCIFIPGGKVPPLVGGQSSKALSGHARTSHRNRSAMKR